MYLGCKVKRALDDQFALSINRDNVIAVVEHHRLCGSTKIVLQEANVAQACAIILYANEAP